MIAPELVLTGKRIRLQQTFQESLINAAAEPFTAVDNHHRHMLIVAIAQSRIGVNVDFFDSQPVRYEDSFRLVA
jgi:hypothetical protein